MCSTLLPRNLKICSFLCLSHFLTDVCNRSDAISPAVLAVKIRLSFLERHQESHSEDYKSNKHYLLWSERLLKIWDLVLRFMKKFLRNTLGRKPINFLLDKFSILPDPSIFYYSRWFPVIHYSCSSIIYNIILSSYCISVFSRSLFKSPENFPCTENLAVSSATICLPWKCQ